MSNDKYQRLRGALAAGPTPGPWHHIEWGAQIVDNGEGSSQLLIAQVAINTHLDRGRHNANYIAAASPEVIAELLAERDRWVVSGREWHNKTEWLQTNAINPRYLGMHRADILRDQIERLTSERDALRGALTVAREYVETGVSYRRAAYEGYEDVGRVSAAEADLARIGAALAMGDTDGSR